MSGIDLGSLISWDNIQDFINDAKGLFSISQANVIESNPLDKNSAFFRAVVISNPKIIEVSEYEALVGGSDSKSDRSYKKFKVRIVNKGVNPHAILEDPCDINTAIDRCEQNALVAAHTTVVTSENLGINIGSFVEIKLKRTSSGAFGIQTGELVKVIEKNETGQTFLNSEVCQSVKRYFKYGDVYEPAPAIEISTPVREAAQLYEITDDIPGKREQRKYLFGYPNMPAVKPPFDSWVKALIYLAYENGFGEVVIISGYRTQAEQERLHRKYKARKAAHPKGPRSKWGLPAACGTCSRHRFGFAIDLNFYDPSGKFVRSDNDKRDWEGFVQIADAIGLTWGGTFAQYDPVHFELNPDNWGDNADMFHEMLEGSGKVEAVPTGDDTSLEKEANEEYIAAVGFDGNKFGDEYHPAKDAARAMQEAQYNQVTDPGEYDEYNSEVIRDAEFDPLKDMFGGEDSDLDYKSAGEWSD